MTVAAVATVATSMEAAGIAKFSGNCRSVAATVAATANSAANCGTIPTCSIDGFRGFSSQAEPSDFGLAGRGSTPGLPAPGVARRFPGTWGRLASGFSMSGELNATKRNCALRARARGLTL